MSKDYSPRSTGGRALGELRAVYVASSDRSRSLAAIALLRVAGRSAVLWEHLEEAPLGVSWVLEGPDALRRCREIRGRDEASPILVVGRATDPDFLEAAVAAGASDVVAPEAIEACLAPRLRLVEGRASTATAAASERLIPILLEAIPTPVFYKDATGRYRGCNSAFETYLGKSASELLGRTVWDIAPPDLAKVYAAADEELFARGGIQTYESSVLYADGTRHEVIFYKSCFYGPDGRLGGLVGTMLDITERRAAERALEALNRELEQRVRERTWALEEATAEIQRELAERARLEEQLAQAQKMEALGRLAGGIAHDFNNILLSILGYTDLARSKLGPDHVALLDLKEVSSAADRAAALVRQLLLFGRRQGGEPRILSLNDLLDELSCMLRPLVREDVRMVIDPGADLPPARVDPSHFGQVLLNLVVNACDAMPSGGTLTLRTRTAPPQGGSARVALEVEDTGAGIPEANLGRIFEPFFTTKSIGKGSGLGLSIAYGLVRASQGELTVASEVGVGSIFTVVLPAEGGGALLTSRRVTSEQVARGIARILVVEDEPAVRQVVATQLARLGYEVLVAEDGLDGLERTRREAEPIDLVLADVVMPRMGGRELARALRGESKRPKLLLMSGYAGELSEDEVIAEGAAGLLQKPFSVAELARRIRDALSGIEHHA